MGGWTVFIAICTWLWFSLLLYFQKEKQRKTKKQMVLKLHFLCFWLLWVVICDVFKIINLCWIQLVIKTPFGLLTHLWYNIFIFNIYIVFDNLHIWQLLSFDNFNPMLFLFRFSLFVISCFQINIKEQLKKSVKQSHCW